ncbi:MAG: PAS domain S-box protein, partial [Deltaproteobacteria bacterium]|nr:PAS domain S-box protein [Deltaproteobacteria bacterium]
TARAEESLKESEAKYQDLYDNAPDMFISVKAATGKVVRCNQTLITATGYAREEIVGCHISEVYHPDCRAGLEKASQLFKETGEVHDVELQLKRKDGRKIEISLSVSAVRDEEGNVLYSRSILRDITKRKRVEETLRVSEEQVRLLLYSTAEAIYSLDMQGNCTFFNPACLKLLGYKKATDLLGQNMHALIHHSHADGA